MGRFYMLDLSKPRKVRTGQDQEHGSAVQEENLRQPVDEIKKPSGTSRGGRHWNDGWKVGDRSPQ